MMTDDVTIPVDVAPVEIAQERKTPSPTQREVVFDIRDLAGDLRTDDRHQRRQPRDLSAT